MSSREIGEYLDWLTGLDPPSESDLSPGDDGILFERCVGNRGPSQEAVGAVDAVYRGERVQCTKEEYQSGVRDALQKAAGDWIDGGDNLRAMIALEEVRRLDKEFELFKKISEQ